MEVLNHHHRHLRVAHEVVLAVYHLTRDFPKSEVYGLTSQARSAAVSIPANIAEGFRKRTSAEKSRFLNIAEGSLEEVRYYFILAGDLGSVDLAGDYDALRLEIEAFLEKYE